MSDDDGGGLGVAAVRSIARSVAESIIRSVFGVRNLGLLKVVGQFAQAPIQFLRGRLIPVFLGGFFGFVFDLADLLAQPFVVAQTGISTLGGSLLNAQRAIFATVITLVNSVYGWLTAATSGLGPLQPFVLAAVAIGTSYVTIVVSIRLVRSVADSIPGASGVETFIFG